jgi:hypothetical protein
MAARRERERRRPSGERRYSFATPEPAVEPDVESDGEATQAVETPRTARTTIVPAAASTRGGVKAAPKAFSAYREEYAYVYGDLRRVGAVIGGLLVALIVLYFVLPLLVH